MSLLRRSRRPRACARSSPNLLPRPHRLKPKGPRLASVVTPATAGDASPVTAEGNDAAAWRSARGGAADRLRVRSSPADLRRRQMPAVGARVRVAWHRTARAAVRSPGTEFRSGGDAAPTGRCDYRCRLVVRCRRVPPSAHLDVSGRAPAVNPQGVDCRRHAAAGAKPCVRMGAPHSPATGRALSAFTIPSLCLSVPVAGTKAKIITGVCPSAPGATVGISVALIAGAIASCVAFAVRA